MPHLVAAPDKFRGTADAADVAASISNAARRVGWSADGAPMSDGGEGLLEAVGGTRRVTEVEGPLGQLVSAEWRLLPESPDAPRRVTTAVIEMARAAGRALVPQPSGEDPVRATTAGVGQLLLAAMEAGARRIIVGCGGSATTDGGWGAVQAVASPEMLNGVEIIVASDVTTAFRDAAALFGPQKGATTEQIARLTARLDELSDHYRREFGVDVDALPGAGAAGGLAGGLAALGARIAPGFEMVASLIALAERVAAADLVVTGEGHLDPPSFTGKVPGGVLALAAGRCPVLCIVGGADADLLQNPPTGLEIVSLTQRFGARRARTETLALVEQVVSEALPRFCP
jgi:glycerate kinase